MLNYSFFFQIAYISSSLKTTRPNVHLCILCMSGEISWQFRQITHVGINFFGNSDRWRTSGWNVLVKFEKTTHVGQFFFFSRSARRYGPSFQAPRHFKSPYGRDASAVSRRSGLQKALLRILVFSVHLLSVSCGFDRRVAFTACIRSAWARSVSSVR